jgi:uncharacterized FlaG/YvyC family protein
MRREFSGRQQEKGAAGWMLRPINTSSASAGSAPMAVQANTAVNLSVDEGRATAIAAVESARAAEAASHAAEQMFRYNSLEFVYRQDIGRIVLIGQSPETGERVVQVPSEQALRAYERTARVERQMERIQSNRASAQKEAFQPAAQPAPQLARALGAAVGGDDNGSGVVSVSA